MGFCTECGTAMGDGKFCGGCGHPAPTTNERSRDDGPSLTDFRTEFLYPGPVPKEALRGNASQRLFRLGNIQGRPRDEIINVLGAPSAESAVGNGCTLLQWQRVSAFTGSWHYALIFDHNGICGGITHQSVQ